MVSPMMKKKAGQKKELNRERLGMMYPKTGCVQIVE